MAADNKSQGKRGAKSSVARELEDSKNYSAPSGANHLSAAADG